jgi:hypothetical protein
MCCRLLAASRQGYCRYLTSSTSKTQLCRVRLTGLIREINVASLGTYGYRRVHAELTIAMGFRCSSHLVSELLAQAGIGELLGPTRVKH